MRVLMVPRLILVLLNFDRLMLRIISPLVLLLAAMACQSSKSDDAANSNEMSTHAVDPLQEEFDRLNTTLFEDLVSDNYGPHTVRSSDGHLVLDWQGYESYLKMVSVFGRPFIAQERERCMPCLKALDSLKYIGEPEAGWEPEACPFAFMYWLNGQEKPTGFEIEAFKIDGDHASSKMVFFEETEDGKQYWNDRIVLAVEYGKEDDHWKIFKLNKLLQN